MKIRPTTDFVKEAIFNILADRVEGAVVLDLFSGTGSLGIEALSRGGTSAVFIDKYQKAVDNIKRNIAACRLEPKGQVIKRDILRGLKFLKKTSGTFDLVFMDPPYEEGLVLKTLELLAGCQCLSTRACVVAEHSPREQIPSKVERFQQIRARKYGNTLVSFYESVL
jgi:16S rRNA (guanine(966)-N(2))-methyltransferase RsmD